MTSPPRHPRERPPNPAFGPLCARCGTAGCYVTLCRKLSARPSLWADGWVDLHAFGLGSAFGEGWPEVREGPTAVVVHGGLGPEGIRTQKGPWVRTGDAHVATAERVAATAVLAVTSLEPAEAVSLALGAPQDVIDAWRRPTVVVRTSGCGAQHEVVVRRGQAIAVDHEQKTVRRGGVVLQAGATRASCPSVLDRWSRADVGRILVDVTAAPDQRYGRVGHDEAVLAAFRIFVAATLAWVRCAHIDVGEPDRWLAFEGRPAPLGEPAYLYESTRPIPIGLISAPPTWLWSDEELLQSG